MPQVFDSIAIRIDGPKAWDEHLLMSSVITDAGTTHVNELRNGVLNHRVSQAPVAGSTTFTLTRPTLIGLVTGTVDLGAGIADGTVTVDGDPADLQRLVDLLAQETPTLRSSPP